MLNHKKSVKVSLILTYVLMVSLAILVFTVPFIIIWYVEIRNRPEYLPSLSAVIMLTFYPCVPIAFLILFKFRNLLKNFLNDEVFTFTNVSNLYTISLCMIIITAILLISGYFYMPFWVASAATAICSLTLHIMKNIIQSGCPDKITKSEEDK